MNDRLRDPLRILLPATLVAALSAPAGFDAQELRQLTNDAAFDYHPVFSPAGDEVLFTSRADGPAGLFRIPVSGGMPVRVAIERTGDLYSDWSPDGRSIVFDARIGDGPPDIFLLRLDSGGVRQLTDQPGMDGHPSFSPSGDRIAFTSTRSGDLAIWTMSADGSDPVRLTAPPARAWHARWSPAGDRILFTSDREGSADIWTMGTDGRELRRLTSLPGTEDRGFWSPDGARIVFQHDDDLWLVSAEGGEPARLTDFPGHEGNPAWSPDGRWIAFVSDRAGHYDIWLLAPPARGSADRRTARARF